MLPVIFLFILGLVLICIGGDRLVGAATAISAQFGIPQIVVGATIVSFSTTLPEILVSTSAIHTGSAAICVGNAIGSIICNTGLIAGLSLLVRPSGEIAFHALLWRSVFFFAVLISMLIYGQILGTYSTPVGVSLLLLFAAYALLSIHFARDEEETGADPKRPHGSLLRHILILLVCAVLLFKGADLLVDNGIILAEYLGIPERIIAVTAIALGTSLPELVTTILSLIRRNGDIGLGNVIGANLLNLLLVIGIPAAFCRIPLESATLYVDMPLAAAVMVILAVPTLIRKRSSRVQGVLLLFIYFAYCQAAL